MEKRVHMLLVLAGEEGPQLEARDFKKLSQVIVNEYLSQANAAFRNYLIEIITKVVRGVPLKSHLYAGLTVIIAKNYPDLAAKIVQNVVGTLQTDLSVGNFNQTLNSLNYLSETMNVSYINSINFMCLLQDLLQSAQKQPEPALKKSLFSLLTKTLPLCFLSLHEKTFFQLKKFLDKMKKQCQNDELFMLMYQRLLNGPQQNYSLMNRLGVDDFQVTQLNGKLRLLIDLKNARGKEAFHYADLYKWEAPAASQEYEQFKKGDGLVVRMWLEQLIDTFSTNSSMLIVKINNLAKTCSQNQTQARFLTECLLLRALRSKNGIAECSLLVNLRSNEQLPQYSKTIQIQLNQLFNSAEHFELTILVSYAKLFAYIVNNSKDQIDWNKYADNDNTFLKRAALMRLILEKITLLNDKFKCPTPVEPFENSKPATSQEEFTSASDQDIFEKMDKAIKQKIQASTVMAMITNQRQYQIFLQALFRRTCLSQTHLQILSERYSSILSKFNEWDWDLINKIRNFFKNSFFHRLLYLRFMINNKYLSFSSYINYVGGLKNKKDIDMIWIKMELNELNNEFGKQFKTAK